MSVQIVMINSGLTNHKNTKIYVMNAVRSIVMKSFIFSIIIVSCIMIVGYVEDPCTTEGLMQGCME